MSDSQLRAILTTLEEIKAILARIEASLSPPATDPVDLGPRVGGGYSGGPAVGER